MFLCFRDVQVIIPEVHMLPCHVLILVSARCYSAVVCCLNSHNTDGAACLCTWCRCSGLGGISPPLLLPPTSFFCPQSTSVTLGDSVRLFHLPPLSPPLCPAVCLCARSSHGSVRAVQMLLINPARKTARHPESSILVQHNLDPTF